tara:strand:+ start:454 stop:675 length:222 start_codon:yes stop_codon:yes gene_type:complete
VKKEVFYEITHRGRSAGFFKERDAAERCAAEFRTEIEGGLYPVEIITRQFLDYAYGEGSDEEDVSSEWESGGV